MVLEAPPVHKNIYILDITTGSIGAVAKYLQHVVQRLSQPPELEKIFTAGFEFSRIRVSVQLSEKLPDLAAGFEHDDDDDMEPPHWRTAEEYERKRGQAPARDWEEVRGDVLGPLFQRGIILGDPGFGKSWLLRYEGIEIANATLRLLQASEIGSADALLPVFARLEELGETTGATLLDRLQQLLKADSEAYDFGKLWPLIEEKARNGKALLLLDGWDEIARDKRETLRLQLRNFVNDNPNCRLLLTSRFAGFQPIELKATQCDLVTLSPEQVEIFITNFFGGSSAGKQLAAQLRKNLGDKNNNQIRELGRIPLMLALLCRLHLQRNGADLPTRRVEIYEGCLNGLALEWKPIVNNQIGEVEAKELVKERLNFAADLALKIFLNFTRIDARKSDELIALMREDGADGRTVARNFDSLIKDGILVRETPDPGGPLRFLHRTFQEYLAGSAIARCVNEQGWETGIKVGRKTVTATEIVSRARVEHLAVKTSVAELQQSGNLPELKPTGWEETFSLAAALLQEPDDFLQALADYNLPLAGRCAVEAGERVSPRQTAKLREKLAERSRDKATDLRARISAGLALGALGDPRFEPRQGRFGHHFLLPPLVAVDGGYYTIGSNDGSKDEMPAHKVKLARFCLSRFPVTNAEYRCFIDADGYEDVRWWEPEAARLWRRDWSGDKRKPEYWEDAAYNAADQPVVGVCWYEARAYCAWLSAQTGQPYRLPTEVEWEAAARGREGRRYAWGDDFDAACCNVFETGVLRPTPIGVFPDGHTPRRAKQNGLADMTGNVWEWTSTVYDQEKHPYPYKAEDGRENGEGDVPRVARGGSWRFDAGLARCAFRRRDQPDLRGVDLGFRVVLGAAPVS